MSARRSVLGVKAVLAVVATGETVKPRQINDLAGF